MSYLTLRALDKEIDKRKQNGEILYMSLYNVGQDIFVATENILAPSIKDTYQLNYNGNTESKIKEVSEKLGIINRLYLCEHCDKVVDENEFVIPATKEEWQDGLFVVCESCGENEKLDEEYWNKWYKEMKSNSQ